MCLQQVAGQSRSVLSVFFFKDTAAAEIYTLSLHDALPILAVEAKKTEPMLPEQLTEMLSLARKSDSVELKLTRSEEHTSELQSPVHLVCRLLLEKKKHNPVWIELHRDDRPGMDRRGP